MSVALGGYHTRGNGSRRGVVKIKGIVEGCSHSGGYVLPKETTLETLCLRTIAVDFSKFKGSFKYLPNCLKNDLINIASQRLHLLEDIDLLESLLNLETEMILLDNCRVTNAMLMPIKICQHLKMFNIGSETNLTSEALCDIFQYVKELEQFTAKKCPAVNDVVITSLSSNCPRLSIVDLANCENVGDESLISLANKPLKAINVGGSKVTDAGVTQLVCGKPKETLREFNLDHCCISVKSVQLTIEMCTHLSIFSFKNNQYAEDFNVPETMKLKQLVWTIL